ncbi:MAG: response regulator [Anaerolineae bacterium]|nr:response regulator [Anaerolineae bacterium]
MIDRTEFERLVKDALSNIHNYAALETHPLVSYFSLAPDQQISRGEHLRLLLLQAIDRLRPPGKNLPTTSMEWRPYFILKQRYLEGLTIDELKTQLLLSGRQLRREHGRALKAVATLLWDQAAPNVDFSLTTEPDTKGEWGTNFQAFQAFEITQKPLNLGEIVQEIARIFRQRVQNENVQLHLELPPELPPVLADRIILRQIILTLFSYALEVQSGHLITAGAGIKGTQVTFWIQVRVDEGDGLSVEEDEEDTSLEFARYWSQRLGATFEEVSPPNHQAGVVDLILSLPQANQGVALIVDDQETAIRMFRRYLSQTNLEVVGVKEPDQVLPLARQLHPQVITLDVMMPSMDGWEILQTLQTDPQTQHIPVIVCSVWDEPELAFSLGAADFLKKPITQKDLLAALTRLQLMAPDTTAESSPTDS